MQRNTHLKICQWNARSILPKHGELQNFLHQHSPDVVCLQETWLNPKINFSLPGYNIIREDRMDKTFGGVLIAIKKNIEFTIISDLRIPNQLEWTAIQIEQDNQPLVIFNIYRPPSRFIDLNGWKQFFNVALSLGKEFLVCGDFNAQNKLWGSTIQHNESGSIIETLLSDLDIDILNTGQATRKLINRPSHLISVPDLSICSKNLILEFEWEVNDERMDSDHYPIIITWIKYASFHKVSIRERINTTKVDWVKFNKEIKKTLEELNLGNPKEAYEKIITEIPNNIILTGGKKTNNKRSTPPPTIWWTDECSELIQERREMEKDFGKNPSRAKFKEYMDMRKKTKRELRKIKRRSFRAFCNSLSPSRFFKIHLEFNKGL